jgi:hypothetical protein
MEDFVKIGIPSLSFVFTLALTLGTFSWSNLLNAQTTQDQQQTAPQSQPSQTPSQQAPDDRQSQAQSQTDNNTFTGTIVKSGDKYMLEDAASGKTYDLDHQDEVQKFDGKKVKVHGTLDASGKTIHLQ